MLIDRYFCISCKRDGVYHIHALTSHDCFRSEKLQFKSLRFMSGTIIYRMHV